MGKFTAFLLAWKKNLAAQITEADKIEEFLLTVGLAYRDMMAIHSTPADPQSPLPDYLDARRSLLTQRIKDVCDSILDLTHEDIKRCTPQTDALIPKMKHPPAPSHPTKNVTSIETSCQRGASQLQPSTVLATNVPRSSTRSEESPIVLPLPRPRKRARVQASANSGDDDLVKLYTFLDFIDAHIRR